MDGMALFEPVSLSIVEYRDVSLEIANSATPALPEIEFRPDNEVGLLVRNQGNVQVAARLSVTRNGIACRKRDNGIIFAID